MKADDPADIQAAHQIYNAAFAEDVPDFPATTAREFDGRIRYPWPGRDNHYWLADRDGRPAGLVTLEDVLEEMVGSDRRHAPFPARQNDGRIGASGRERLRQSHCKPHESQNPHQEKK